MLRALNYSGCITTWPFRRLSSVHTGEGNLASLYWTWNKISVSCKKKVCVLAFICQHLLGTHFVQGSVLVVSEGWGGVGWGLVTIVSGFREPGSDFFPITS